MVLSGGAENPRDLPVPGRELRGVHFAMDFLRQQNKACDWRPGKQARLPAKDKHVIVIGGGDTGSDCVGTSNRHGGGLRHAVRTDAQAARIGKQAHDLAILACQAAYVVVARRRLRARLGHNDQIVRGQERQGGKADCRSGRMVKDKATGQMKMREVEGSQFEMPADLVLLAMGFVSPVKNVLDAFGVDLDARGNARANTDDYITSTDKVFAAGDMRRGQSLVVWAIREGRQCARSVDQFLMGSSTLPS